LRSEACPDVEKAYYRMKEKGQEKKAEKFGGDVAKKAGDSA